MRSIKHNKSSILRISEPKKMISTKNTAASKKNWKQLKSNTSRREMPRKVWSKRNRRLLNTRTNMRKTRKFMNKQSISLKADCRRPLKWSSRWEIKTICWRKKIKLWMISWTRKLNNTRHIALIWSRRRKTWWIKSEEENIKWRRKYKMKKNLKICV